MPKSKYNSKGPVTNEYLDDAADNILKGMQKMFDNQDKLNDTKFATKEDLKAFATKEDLKRETSFIRQDINDLKAEIATSPTREEFNKFKSKFATS